MTATATTAPSAATIEAITQKAKRLSILSMMSTTAAGSGHPTSCMSAAELVAGTFFYAMKFDPKDPNSPDSDRFVLSKGHAAPVLYAALAEAGVFPASRLMTLREFSSELEGHPTPRIPGVDAATGSLGQGLSVGSGLAIGARMDKSPTRVYVLMGDGEMAEGQVWEAAAFAAHYKLDNLTVLADVNALGQSEPTMYRHDMEVYRKKFELGRLGDRHHRWPRCRRRARRPRSRQGDEWPTAGNPRADDQRSWRKLHRRQGALAWQGDSEGSARCRDQGNRTGNRPAPRPGQVLCQDVIA